MIITINFFKKWVTSTNKIDKEKFRAACYRFASNERTRDSIGTLGEKSLHAVLKWYYETDGDRHEIPVGAYVADIVGEYGIIEIQTRNFVRLKPKLAELLTAARVTVVYPIISQKRIINISAETGEVISSRQSPKHGSPYTAIHELYAIRELLANPRLTLKMPILSADEVRVFGVKTKRRKKQHTRSGEYVSDIIPHDIIDEITLDKPEDYHIFLPGDAEGLPQPFDSAEFAAAAHIDRTAARRILNILTNLGLTQSAGKRGRAKLYAVCAENRTEISC